MRWTFLLLTAATVAWAKTDVVSETTATLEDFAGGRINVNQAINRVKRTGGEEFASLELVVAYKRAGEHERTPILEFLAGLAYRNKNVEDTFLRALTHQDPAEIVAAEIGLGRIRSAEGVKPLTANLGSQNFGVRREAARALGLIGKPAASAPLLAAAKKEGDLDLKLLMIQSAGRAGDKKQVGALETMLKDSSESTRLAAAQALCAMGTPSCAKFAGVLLSSKEKTERMQGVMLFEGASAKQAGKVLSPALNDADPRVRARAARLLAEGGDESKKAWLVVESAKAEGDARLIYEDELEPLRLTDEQRSAILKKAGYK